MMPGHIVMHLSVRPSVRPSVLPSVPLWLTHFDRFFSHQYCLPQSFDICMDVVFDHSPHTHIIWPHFDLDIDLILDLDFKWANFLVNPFWPFRLTSILLATKLWYLHGCCIWSFSTHQHHLTLFWPWHWPNFGLRLQVSQFLG